MSAAAIADQGQLVRRSVVMVTSPGRESSLPDVVVKLGSVCAAVGQTVAIVSTAIIDADADTDEKSFSPPLWWLNWPTPQDGAASVEDERRRLQSDGLRPADIEALLGETGVDGVRRLDLRYFVKHPAQVVIRAPQVIAELRQIVDVVILEVPAYLTVHHGEGLTPIADAVVVVGERNNTTMDDLRRMKTALTRLAAPVVGLTLTGAHRTADVWGAEFEPDSIDDDSLDDTKETDLRDLVAAGGTGRHAVLENERAENGASENGASENGSTQNGSTQNGSEHDAADAILARQDVPEA